MAHLAVQTIDKWDEPHAKKLKGPSKLHEVRYREEFLPFEIAELKKEIETLEDRFTDFSGQTMSVVFLTSFDGYAGLHAAVREVRDLPTKLARQLIREGSAEPATAVHVSNWQRLQAKKAAQAQVAFS